MVAISFIKPQFLFLLAIIPFLIFIHFYTLKRKRSRALSFANFDAISRIKGIDLLSKNVSILIATVLVASLIIVSIAGVTVQRDVFASSFSFGIAIDSSRSMEADDIFPTRIDAAKETALTFVDQVSGGTKMAVISFAGNAFIEQSTTEDKTLIKQAINEIPISSIGGTDLSEAVITSTNLLRGEESKSIIILSDGRVNVGTLELAIEYANENDVIVHTIGMGTESGGKTSFGSLSTIDEESLKGLAFNTGGQFFKAESKEALAQSFRSIMGLKLSKVSFNITPYILLVTLVLLVVEYVLINTRFTILP